MRIKFAPPPNMDAIDAVFGCRLAKGRLYCYGDTIYYPIPINANPLPQFVIDHEIVHSEQQTGMGVEKWWDIYLADKNFRYEQELPAHVREYQSFLTMNPNRESRRKMTKIFAERLSGPIYGHLVTFEKAKRLITCQD